METSQPQRVHLVIPVFNDWDSLLILLSALDNVFAEQPVRLAISVVDDGSTQRRPDLQPSVAQGRSIDMLEVIRLAGNLGHQRAIAVGICAVAEAPTFDALLIMDSDGEDPPAAIPALLARAAGQEEFCVVAARRKRSESLAFKISYFMYKSIFVLLTGTQISFGNFSLLSPGFAQRLTVSADLWNNLPAAILRSRLPIQKVPMDRGSRYAGKSNMNFTSLIVHGLSAISVYADTIFVRLLFACAGLTALSAVAIVTTVTLRLFVPAHATPGWATTVSFGMVIILLQVLFTALTSLLMLLNNRVQRLILPARDYAPYIRERQVVFHMVR